jgi:4-oxalocrotonate tautomerase
MTAIKKPRRRPTMPIVRVEMYPGRTHAQKAELARVITEAVVAIAKTTPEHTTVVFEDGRCPGTGPGVGARAPSQAASPASTPCLTENWSAAYTGWT